MGNKKTRVGPVLVTGGSGFIGAHLVSAFAGGFETYYTFLSWPVRDLAGAEGLQADVVDGPAIAKLIEAIHPRVILHAAALPDFNRCASNPNEARKVNVEGSRTSRRVPLGFQQGSCYCQRTWCSLGQVHSTQSMIPQRLAARTAQQNSLRSELHREHARIFLLPASP